MCLPRYEAYVALLREGAKIFMLGFLNPGWDIFCRTRVTGQDGQYTTDWECFHAAYEFHERPWAETAPCVYFFIYGNFCEFWHGYYSFQE
jgi:hypothetical protein